MRRIGARFRSRAATVSRTGHALRKIDPLAVGTYNDARRWPFAGAQPALSFSGTGRGCNTLTGSFVIREMVLGAGGTLDRFQASFEQHCEGRSPALRGDVSIAANPWR